MNTNEINCVLSKFIKKPFSVVARDELPFVDISHLPLAIVVNTDVSTGKGIHWCGFYVTLCNSKVVGYFFDSYANPFTYYNFDPPFKVIESSKKVLQPNDSSTCGIWTIAWLIHMAKGGSIRSFECKYSGNLEKNDAMLLKKYAHMQNMNCWKCVPRMRNMY